MERLNFPSFPFRIKDVEGKRYIWDGLRGKWYVLTAEEWVRQHTVQYLHQILKYPSGRIALEVMLRKNRLKRSDIVVYDAALKPDILVECKRTKAKITRETFDQIARYNLELKANYLMVTNGLSHYYAKVNAAEKRYDFLPTLPIHKA